MKHFPRRIALLLMLSLARVLHAGPPANVRVIVNQGVRDGSISASALKNIYTGRTNYWDDGERVVIAVLADRTDEALDEVSGMEASEFRTFWQRLVFSGRGEEPRKATDAASLVALVASTRGAIALVPTDVPLKGVKALDVNWGH
jgi:ABC-type phosphate transport system substrate-binding protein